MHQKEYTGSIVRATARPESDPDDPREWSWVEASVWTDRMLAALGNGVRGGKWHSLIDKVYAPQTLWAAWQRVKANHGAAGIDRMSVERFEANATYYLKALELALRNGSYKPAPIRRVYIPKGKGKTRPLGIATVKDRPKMPLDSVLCRKAQIGRLELTRRLVMARVADHLMFLPSLSRYRRPLLPSQRWGRCTRLFQLSAPCPSLMLSLPGNHTLKLAGWACG